MQTRGKQTKGQILLQKYILAILTSSKRIDLSCGQSDRRSYCLLPVVPPQQTLALVAMIFSIYKAQLQPKQKQKVHAWSDKVAVTHFISVYVLLTLLRDKKEKKGK